MADTPTRGASGAPLGPLAETGWLAEQPADFRARIAALGRWTLFRRGAQLYAEGDGGAAVYGVGEGLLDLVLSLGFEDAVLIHRAGAGFWIGESAVLADATRGVTLRAATECRLFVLPAAAVKRLLAERPAYWTYFYRLSHRNTALAIRVVAELLSLRPKSRFARLLLRLAGPDGKVRATQGELGRLAGMSRAGFRRALGDLIAGGRVVTRYGAVWIVDRAALEALARGG